PGSGGYSAIWMQATRPKKLFLMRISRLRRFLAPKRNLMDSLFMTTGSILSKTSLPGRKHRMKFQNLNLEKFRQNKKLILTLRFIGTFLLNTSFVFGEKTVSASAPSPAATSDFLDPEPAPVDAKKTEGVSPATSRPRVYKRV